MSGEPQPARAETPQQDRLTVGFDLDSLYRLRSAVAAHAEPLGLRGERLSRLLVVATELATNAVRHGGGRGVLHLWAADGAVYCQVTDDGPGIAEPHTAGVKQVQLARDGGRGLWLVRAFADEVEIGNGLPGTVVTVRFGLDQ